MRDRAIDIAGLSAEEKRALLSRLLMEKAAASASAHPLSYGQRALWFIHQLAPDNPAYTISYAGRIRGDLDIAALERAAQALVERNAILRTTFAMRDGQPVQLVHPQWPVRIARQDVDPEQVEQWIRQESCRTFDLQTGPVIRLTLLRVSPEEHILILAVHHIAADFWSIDLILDELCKLYGAEHGAAAPPLCPEQYVNYAQRQQRLLAGSEGDRLWSYWRSQLDGELPKLGLYTDRPRPATPTHRSGLARFGIDGHRASGLRDVARSAGATPYMTFFAAYAALLHRYTGQDDLLIASPFACREGVEMEGLVGYVANPVVLRADLTGDPAFLSLVGRVKQTVLGALAHQDYPFALLVERLRPSRELNYTPIVQVSFAWEQPRRFQEHADGDPRRKGLALETVHVGQGGAAFDLMIQVADADGEFTCDLYYNADLFDDATIERMVGHFRTLVDGIISDPASRLSQLPLRTETECRQQAAWNDTRVSYDAPDCLHDMVAEIARRTPHQVAVSFGDHETTYAELDRRANALAHQLQGLGVGPDTIVPVLMDRSAELVVALLGVLKAGGAFMPLDPAHPTNRVAAMLANVREAPVCLIHLRYLDTVECFTGQRLAVDSLSMPPTADTVTVDAGTTSTHLAYVVHTSGSTGTPKGVLNTHGGIRNRLLWMQAQYQLTPDDRVLHKTPASFDPSIWEIFWPLIVGARLVIAEPEIHKDAVGLIRTIVDQEVTTVHFVPSMLRSFLGGPGVTDCARLRRVFCSGEVLPYDLQEQFLATLSAELYNLYGPTEAAIDVTHFHCERGESRSPVPIGRPIANIGIYILDTHGQPVPVGVPGELCIGGVGVARGYLNQPAATAASFLPDPFAGDADQLMYRTGDMARYLPDGNIEYLGRLDDQVKIRGVRIEPAEVEAAIQKHPAVRENAVVANEDPHGTKRLVAHIVMEQDAAAGVAELRRFLLEELPAAMVPAVFSVVESLPHTSSGKIDRRALKAAGEAAPVTGPEFAAPRTPAEKILAQIWREVLDLETVGVHDDFFALGGSSSHSLEVTAKANAANLPLQPESVFAFGTIAELAAEYGSATQDLPGVAEPAAHGNAGPVNDPGRTAQSADAAPVRATGTPRRNTVIESIGVYLPGKVLSTDEVLAGCVNEIGIPLERLTGIKSRRVVEPGEFSIDLARKAVQDCLARSSYAPGQIDLVICCNISRYDGPGHKIMFEPSTAARLRDQCDLANATAFDVSNACAGMFTGVAIADAFLQAGLVESAMVVSGEYTSHVTQTAQREIEGPMDPRLACLTVGDAGAAVILERGPNDRAGFHDIDMATLSRYSTLCMAKATSGAHGGAIMTVDSVNLTATVVKRLVPYAAAVMSRHGWHAEHCEHFVIHQTSKTSLNDAMVAMNQVFGPAAANPHNVVNNLAERGNTASTTHFVALSDQIRADRIKPGDKVVFGISGTGQTIGAALYTFDDLPARMRRTLNGRTDRSLSARRRRPQPPATSRVKIQSVAITPGEQAEPRSAIDLAGRAARSCLSSSGLDPAELGLVIYAGVYREDFLAEPAIAALVARELGANEDIDNPHGPKTFAFDVLNGPVGFLNACQVGVQMLGAGKAEHAMVVAAEIENNRVHRERPLYGIGETGSAVILTNSEDDSGFGRFVFHHHAEYGATLETYLQQANGVSWLQIDRDPNLTAYYLDCIPAAVEELLKLDELERSQIAAVFPPHLSPPERAELAARLDIPLSRFVDHAAGFDPFSSSLPYGLEYARRHGQVNPGDIGLIVSVGSGIEVGCATYRFG